MKIFSSRQLYEADKFTLEKQQISSVALMERAGKQAFIWLHSRFENTEQTFHIFCGMGNNGGDGLVIGRHLLQEGYKVKLYTVRFRKEGAADFSTNLKRLQKMKHAPQSISGTDDFPRIEKEAIIIDAIFGTGLGRPPEDWVAALIKHINTTGATILAIDIPSGLPADAAPGDPEAVINATFTLTFQLPKRVFFMPQTGKYVGIWETLDIGLDKEYLNKTPSDTRLIIPSTLRKWHRPRERFSHKGTYGHALIIGGSYGKTGAAYLTAKACITSGAGMVTAFIPECGYTVLQTALPEVMVLTDKGQRHISHIRFELQPSVIGLGPGLGTHNDTQQAVLDFLKQNKTPLVIDADGLNILSMHKNALDLLPTKTVLTPHPKELERLIGKWKDDFEKLEKVKTFTRKYNLIVVIKGAYTMVVHNDTISVNTTGNPGMATAGSGDVLTGIITGLIAQGYPPLRAAVLGVYLHGSAGDLAAAKTGYEALTAEKLTGAIGKAFLALLV